MRRGREQSRRMLSAWLTLPMENLHFSVSASQRESSGRGELPPRRTVPRGR
jgi:hypothetical protein